ncbi:hypothetical protein ACHRV1_02910 [Flavobacterium aquidurense]|uniref:hypothetical protein n=1 Tax=Flavobacterium aquidurense TaxID=362413 RepID=UPI0037580D43
MITTVDFYNKLENEDIFTNENFDLIDQVLTINHLKSNWVTFENCTFNCRSLEFKNMINEDIVLNFDHCTFNCSVTFQNCSLESIEFKNTKVLQSLTVRRLTLIDFVFLNESEFEKSKLCTNFNISKTKVTHFQFEKIEHVQGSFKFLGNKLSEKRGKTSFQNSTLTNVLFSENSFLGFSSFKRMYFKSTAENSKPIGAAFEFPGFYKNIFSKVSFSESNFMNTFQFENCDFLDTTWFEECKNLGNSELKFVSCKFEKYSLFDSSKFDKIEILHCKFLEKASFENFETNYFKLHQVTFAGAAYFDDLNKTNNKVIENWDRKTLRSIKRELVNTHNQIDYLRFKAYELKAYKKEVDKSNLRWKDSLILKLGEDSNNFGLDWTKGISFILKWSFFFYALYIVWYAFYINDANCNPTIEEFLVNYLKFLNPFSFLKSPIEDAENYFLPFLFFILGKIFVSYGIYQTIQAFRKFGVNGG